MDTRLRELQRSIAAEGINSDAGRKFVLEMMRLGYEERTEDIGTIDYLGADNISLEDFAQKIENQVKDKHRTKYHRFSLRFYGTCEGGSYDPYDDYPTSCDGVDNIGVSICGVRLETEKEFKARVKRIEKQEAAERERQRAESAARREQQRMRDDHDRQVYERLKRKFESEEKMDKLLTDIGEHAENSLRQYSPSYFKSWFGRKFKKLGGKTPIEVYDEGDIEKLRLFALKAL